MSVLDSGPVDDGTDVVDLFDVDPDVAASEESPPPPDDRMLRTAVDVSVVAACALFVFWQLHPELLLADTTPAGGDMGAHVWAFGYLRDVLLPAGRVVGWTPDWYAGFPVFQFYMVVPFLAMVLVNAGIGGIGAIVPALASLAISARAAGVRRLRPVAAVLGGVAVVAAGAGLWSGYATGFRFVLGAGAVTVAIGVGRFATNRRRWWLVAAAVLVAVVGISMPYGPSFKLVTVVGVVAMPVSSYVFGRLSRFAFPTPALLAVATVWFLFDKNFTIYGGNVASTMAGEFAFSISLALAIAYLGLVVRGLRTGRDRAGAAVLLALVGCCHLIPAFFALGATAVLVVVHIVAESAVAGPAGRRADGTAAGVGLCVLAAGALAFFAGPVHRSLGGIPLLGRLAPPEHVATSGPIVAMTTVALFVVAVLWWCRSGPAAPDDAAPGGVPATRSRLARARVGWIVVVGAVGGLLAAWWVLPFYARTTYLNDMGWEKIAVHASGTGIWDWFTGDVWSLLVPSDLRIPGALALIGVVLSIAFRDRVGAALVIVGLALATAFVFVPQGRLWNARLLPFWYLIVYLLAAVGVGEVVRALAHVFAARPGRPVRPLVWAAAPVGLLVLVAYLGAQLHNLPGGRENADGSYRVLSSVGVPGLFSLDLPDALGFDVSGNNFVTSWSRWNYSGYERKDAYPEYRSIVSTMEDVGRERGCGMSLWEYSADLNDYGTPMALMLLPHWTDGCIGSMEGLYFEASSTTPFHFLMQSELSDAPSRAQRDLPYRDLDLEAGVDHLQLMGVRYYLARSPAAVAAADGQPDLTRVEASGPWVVYEVAGAPRVEALGFEPAVTTASEHQGEWLCATKDENGRCSGAALDWFQDSSRWDVALAADGPDSWQRIAPGDTPERRAEPQAEVSEVSFGRDGISFHVDRPGTPVLVKESYFPNWEARGADGPYRVAPNLMVVVPTDTDVRLTYGRTGVDLLAILLTLAGLALVVALARSGAVAVPRLREIEPPADEPDDATID